MTAADLERRFLAGLDDAQTAYEQIVATEAWLELGHDSFSAWWDSAVRPTMRALSMRPTREIAAAVVERVQQEEAELPPVQRRTQRELGEMVGITQKRPSRSSYESNDSEPDLDERVARDEVADAIAKHLPPDDPWRGWRSSYLRDIAAAYKVIAHQTPDQVAERADDECVAEFRRLVRELNGYADRLTATFADRYGYNVIAFRSAQ
jgi:hypothetical protein